MSSWVQDHDIKLLRIFYAVAQYGGFSQAQVQLNLSQSSLSTYMSQLEKRLGMQLCTRGHSGFALTEEGKAILRETEILFGALSTFATKVSDAKTNLVGTFSIGVIESSVTHSDARVVEALREFGAWAPDVAIDVYVGDALELANRVLDGRLHAAVGLFPHQVEGLDYLPLFEERHYLYCAKGHPLFDAADQDLSLKVAAQHAYASRDYVDTTAGLEPPEEFRNVASAPHMEGLLYLILTGRYFAYLPDHIADPWVERGQLRRLTIKGMEKVALFHLILRKTKAQPRVLREFLRFIPHEPG